MHEMIRMSENGRIVIPAEIRKQLGLVAGQPLTLTVEGQELRLMSRQARRLAARESVRSYIPPGVDLVAELIADRREEARRELLDD